VSACGTLSSAGEYYVLNQSLNKSTTCITISANNVTLDCGYYGTQYNITGTKTESSYGIYLTGKKNTTIKNCLLSSWEISVYAASSSNNGTYANNTVNNNLDTGFFLYSSSYNNFTNNTANNNNVGFLPISSPYNNFTNNTANNNVKGFEIDFSSTNTFINNSVTKASKQIGFEFGGGSYSDFKNYLDATNTVNGLPVKYYDGVQTPCPNNTVISLDASYSFVGFLGCNNVTLANTTAVDGINLFYTTNSTITNSNASYARTGVNLQYSSRNNLTNNTANDNYRGFYLYESPNNTLANNTVTNASEGFSLRSSSSNVVLVFNNVSSSSYAVALSSSTANVTNNSLSRNVRDAKAVSSTINYSYNTAFYSLDDYVANFSASTRAPAVNSLVSFNFTLAYANETTLTSYSYSLSLSPNEPVESTNSSNLITGNFTPTRSGAYSLTLNLTDDLQNNFLRRYYFLVGAANTATAQYYFSGAYPVHGQPAGVDAKSFSFNPPTQEEYAACASWVTASPDVFVPTYALVTNLSVFVWYKSGDPTTLGVKRFAYYDGEADSLVSVPSSADLVSASHDFGVSWAVDYLFSWRWLSVKLAGWMPLLNTNATSPSILNVTYNYATTPVVRVESGYDDTQILSATSPASDLTQAQIIIEGSAPAALSVLMPSTGTYSVYYDGVYCSAAYTPYCSFSQDGNGNLSISVALGSTTHNASIYPVPTPTPTFYGGGGGTPTPTPTATPSVTATPAPSAQATSIPTASVVVSPSVAASVGASVAPSASVSASVFPGERGVSRSAASEAVSRAREALASRANAVGLKERSEANRLLDLAQQAIQKGDYAAASRYAAQAESVLNPTGVTSASAVAGGVDWWLAGFVGVALIVAACAYYFFYRKKR